MSRKLGTMAETKTTPTNINGNIYLPFEDKIAQLDWQVDELKRSSEKGPSYSAKIRRLQRNQTAELKKIYSSLSLISRTFHGESAYVHVIPIYIENMVV